MGKTPLQFSRTFGHQENVTVSCNAGDINALEFDIPQASWKYATDGRCKIKNHDNYTLFFYKRSKAESKMDRIRDKK
jgi:hypothetical protein